MQAADTLRALLQSEPPDEDAAPAPSPVPLRSRRQASNGTNARSGTSVRSDKKSGSSGGKSAGKTAASAPNGKTGNKRFVSAETRAKLAASMRARRRLDPTTPDPAVGYSHRHIPQLDRAIIDPCGQGYIVVDDLRRLRCQELQGSDPAESMAITRHISNSTWCRLRRTLRTITAITVTIVRGITNMVITVLNSRKD